MAADATLPAADASTTLTTPGKSACAMAAAKIQLRTTREKRPAICFISPSG
jgi:fatty acid/phospholipid biosynthesis enzyme